MSISRSTVSLVERDNHGFIISSSDNESEGIDEFLVSVHDFRELIAELQRATRDTLQKSALTSSSRWAADIGSATSKTAWDRENLGIFIGASLQENPHGCWASGSRILVRPHGNTSALKQSNPSWVTNFIEHPKDIELEGADASLCGWSDFEQHVP